MEEESKIKLLWGALPLKIKLTIIGVCFAALFLIFFLIVMITPLMHLGIIDISNIGSGSTTSSPGYTYVAGNSEYWWPIGSDTTVTIDGKEFDCAVSKDNGECVSPAHSSISSPFGPRNLEGTSGYHWGLDIVSVPTWGVTNIIAVKDGTVIYPDEGDPVDCPSNNSIYENCNGRSYGGNLVKIQHSDGTITDYKHLYENTITVKKGDTVKQGQVIGKMGSSGQSTGTHLHIEFWVNGVRVNPANYISKDNPRPIKTSYNHIEGNDTKQTVCLTLLNSGFSENGVAALMTNIRHESSFRVDALGDNGTSYGLCQWHNSRWDDLKNSFPDTYHTADSQVRFLLYELQNKYPTLYTDLYEGNGSASDLTYDFCYNFERPAKRETSCKKRTNSTGELVNYVENGCQ